MKPSKDEYSWGKRKLVKHERDEIKDAMTATTDPAKTCATCRWCSFYSKKGLWASCIFPVKRLPCALVPFLRNTAPTIDVRKPFENCPTWEGRDDAK